MSSERSLTLFLGPPSDPQQRKLFDNFQRSFGKKETRNRPDWEDFENDLVRAFFAKEGEEPSPMEMILAEECRQPIRADRPFTGIGNLKGLWVMTVTIGSSMVHPPTGDIEWPPEKKICQDIATLFRHYLKRDWVFTVGAKDFEGDNSPHGSMTEV